MEEEVEQLLLRSLEEGEEEPLRFLVVDKRPVHPLEQHQQQRLQQHLLAISLDHRPVMHKQLVVQSLVEEEAHLEVEQQHRVKDRYLVAVHQPAVAFLLPVHPRHLPLGHPQHNKEKRRVPLAVEEPQRLPLDSHSHRLAEVEVQRQQHLVRECLESQQVREEEKKGESI